MVTPEDIIKKFNDMEIELVREEYRPAWSAEQIASVIRNMIERDETGGAGCTTSDDMNRA